MNEKNTIETASELYTHHPAVKLVDDRYENTQSTVMMSSVDVGFCCRRSLSFFKFGWSSVF